MKWWVAKYRVVKGHYAADHETFSLQRWRWWWPWWTHVLLSFSSTEAGAVAYLKPAEPSVTVVSGEFQP